MSLLDFDNFQKRLNWFKERSLYKIWLVSPIILFITMGFLIKQNIALRKNLENIKNEIIPIKELYPKLELSVAVTKLLEDYRILEQEVAGLKQKEEQKKFKPLAEPHQKKLITSLKELIQKYPDIDLNFWIYCVKPSANQFKKVNELVKLFNDANIPTKYSNTIMSATTNIFLVYNSELNKQLINDVARILKIVFLIDKVPIKVDDNNDDKLLELFFLGDPLFDSEGRIFYIDK